MIGPSPIIVPIKSETDIVWARGQGRDLARSLGFGLVDQSRIATAISELTRNIIRYAREGQCVIRTVDGPGRVGIEVLCEDRGPGIDDIEAALRDGFSSQAGVGLGIGLPGARRLMDEMEIQSAPGEGTRVVVKKWRRK